MLFFYPSRYESYVARRPSESVRRARCCDVRTVEEPSSNFVMLLAYYVFCILLSFAERKHCTDGDDADGHAQNLIFTGRLSHNTMKGYSSFDVEHARTYQ